MSRAGRIESTLRFLTPRRAAFRRFLTMRRDTMTHMIETTISITQATVRVGSLKNSFRPSPRCASSISIVFIEGAGYSSRRS